MKVSIFERYAKDLWDYHVHRDETNNRLWDQWKYAKQNTHVVETREQSVERKHKHFDEKDHHNSMMLLSEYYVLARNRRFKSLNAQMNKDFYKLGVRVDVKV